MIVGGRGTVRNASDFSAQLVTALGFGGSAEDLADAIIVLGGVALPEINRRLSYA